MTSNTKRTASAQEISTLFDIPVGTLANMRSAKRGPKYYKIGRRVLYDIAEFEAFIKSHPILTSESIGGAL